MRPEFLEPIYFKTDIFLSIFKMKNVIKIQKLFRGYILRKKIKQFKDLPIDVWNRVLYYIRYQHNIQHSFKKSIMKVYDSKISDCDDIIIDIYVYDDNNMLFFLKSFDMRGYYLLAKNNVNDMFKKYSMIIS